MWQIVKLFFEIGERYFLVALFTLMSPWAFVMGGSKSTADIFKGWARMFASMCVMMVMNVVFLKILLSAMGNMPDDAGVLPWIIFVVAIARVARKIDNVIARIGLNPALTGDGLGHGSLPGMLTFAVMRSVASGAAAGGKSKTPPKGNPNSSGASSAGNGAGSATRGSRSNNTFGRNGGRGSQNTVHNSASTQTTQSTSHQTAAGATGSPPSGTGASPQPSSSGAAGTPGGVIKQQSGQNTPAIPQSRCYNYCSYAFPADAHIRRTA